MNARLKEARGRRALAAAVLAPLLAVATTGAAQADTAPLTWTFDKCATNRDGVWKGTATLGETTEKLRTELLSSPPKQTGDILHVTFDWAVGNVYVARLDGTLDLGTGAVVMNGQVVEGAYLGARVHEEGLLYDAENSCFAGTIAVQPAS